MTMKGIRSEREADDMKIDDMSQISAVSYPGNGRTDRPEAADAQGEASAKQPAATDKVILSKYIAAVSASEGTQDVRVNRVATIKSQIVNGTYQVSSNAVAQKMLSTIAAVASP
jgi:flagellar biosynthesis anti-sigma factor FlgM